MKPRTVALVVALSALLATALAYREEGPIEIDFERGYEGAFVHGFHPRERAEGKFFRWTDDVSFIELENLAPGGALSIQIRLKAIRPAGEPLPNLAFTANGVTVHRARALPGAVGYRFEFPWTDSRLRLGIESETFEAAGGRKLGVQVLGVAIDRGEGPQSWVVPALWMTLAALLLLAAGIIAGLAGPVAFAFALVPTLAFGYLLQLDAVRFTPYPRDITLLAAGSLSFAVLLRAGLNRAGWLPSRERAAAVSILTLLFLIKMAFLSYPLTLSSDADFQANRMSELLQGNWHPTSVTQHEEPFRIPYPVSLYVVATPLAILGVDLVPALEITTGFFDILVSGLLMFVAWRILDDFRAGAIAGVLYQLVPMNALAFSAGNFTNLFAVAMLTFAYVALRSSRFRAAAFANFMALTAHFSMLLEGLVLWPVWIAVSRGSRKRLAIPIAASFVLAGAYYFGYLELFRSQWDRVLGGGGAGAGDFGSRFELLGEQFGWIFLATAILGSASFVRHPIEIGWLSVTLLFFSIDLVTAIEIRYWLQALPLLALFAGVYLSRAFDRGAVGKIAALGVLAYVSVLGFQTLFECMVFRYH